MTGQGQVQMKDEELVQMIRNKIKGRGTRGIQQLGRLFRIWDDSGDRLLQFEEASKAFTELRIGLEGPLIKQAFRIFDRDANGCIDYEEFLRVIRGSMNQFR